MRENVSILPLRIENLCYGVQDKRLVDGVATQINAGGLTAVIGPNGAGKSLFLRLCHGLLQPTSGSVSWSVANGYRTGRKRHAMVFQKPVMLRRNVRDNMLHALASISENRAWKARRVDLALDRFGLQHLVESPARVLSGGEQQRLAIARAWACEPDILFLDEPSAHLDPGATRQIEDVLHALMNEGVTLVMATHDLGQVRRLATRVLFFNRGQLVEQGEAACFFQAPQSPLSRAFVAGELLW